MPEFPQPRAFLQLDIQASDGQNARLRGGIPKRPTGADCKSAGFGLRWFESTFLHQKFYFSRVCGAVLR